MARILAVSPHLDDAVLSYGGQLAMLASAGHQVVVYTVFAGTPSPPYSPLAAAFHGTWELTGDPMAPRRAEDQRALSVLGVTSVHGRFLDAVYRRDERGGWLIQDMQPTEFQGEEPHLLADIAATIENFIREQRPDQVVTCAAIGAHVDHRRARDAAVRAAVRTGAQLKLWTDFPYIIWEPDVVPPLPGYVSLADPVAEPVTVAGLRTWAAAYRCYASQLTMLEEHGPLDKWLTVYCKANASRFGVTGAYGVVREVRVRSEAAGQWALQLSADSAESDPLTTIPNVVDPPAATEPL